MRGREKQFIVNYCSMRPRADRSGAAGVNCIQIPRRISRLHTIVCVTRESNQNPKDGRASERLFYRPTGEAGKNLARGRENFTPAINSLCTRLRSV